LKTTQNGKKVCSFSVAINEGKDKTEFVNCVAWEKTGELVSEYCPKGSRISLTGRMQTRKWQDSDGKDRYSTEVVVNAFDFPPKDKDTRVKKEDDDFEDTGIPF